MHKEAYRQYLRWMEENLSTALFCEKDALDKAYRIVCPFYSDYEGCEDRFWPRKGSEEYKQYYKYINKVPELSRERRAIEIKLEWLEDNMPTEMDIQEWLDDVKAKIANCQETIDSNRANIKRMEDIMKENDPNHQITQGGYEINKKKFNHSTEYWQKRIKKLQESIQNA